MSERLSIRRLGSSDWTRVRGLRLAMLAASADAFGSKAATSNALDEARWQERQRTSVTWHATSDDASVGSATVVADPNTPELTELQSVWVAPAFRRLGVASQLIREVVGFCRRRGVARLELWVLVTNEPAKSLYMRLGFKPTGRTRESDGQLETQLALSHDDFDQTAKPR